MVVKTLLFYAVAVVAAVALFIGIRLAFKFRKKTLSVSHMLIGSLFCGVTIALVIILARLGFSSYVLYYVKAWVSTELYQLVVTALFFFLIGLARFFALDFFYFNRDKSDKGESFLAGYGFCGALIVGIYSLFIFVWLSVTSLGNKLTDFQDGAFLFEDGSVVSTFKATYAAVLLVAFFMIYTALCIIIAEFMSQHASLPYKKLSTVLVYGITSICEILMCSTFYYTVTKVSYVVLILVSVAIMALAAVAVIFLYKYKETLPYVKQFE